MTYAIKTVLGFAHALENIQHDMRMARLWEAARSLEGTVELLRKEAEVMTVAYENQYGHER